MITVKLLNSTKGCVLTPLCYRPSAAHPRHWDRKEAAQRRCSGSEEKTPQDLIPNRTHPIGLVPEARRPAFPPVKGYVVGLGGLEPPPSSLSAKCREPLC
jgi:hypothetical protein